MKRSERQNKALHLMFRHLAEELNEQGMDMRKTLKPGIDIPWNEHTIKEYLWKPLQKAQLMKESTTELDTEEIDAVFRTLSRALSERGIEHGPFPSIETLLAEEELKHEPKKRHP